jgi:RimJ/RimL family protein N-acetyltransferase
MKVVSYSDAEEFWLAAGPLLLADPVGNSLVLTLTRRVRLGLLSDPILLTVHDGPDVIGAALRTPGYPIVVSAVPLSAIAPIVDHLCADGVELSGATGGRSAVEAFGAAWIERTGDDQIVIMDECLYRLGELTPPNDVPGEPAVGTDDDVDLLAGWGTAFVTEALSERAATYTLVESTRQVRASQRMGNGQILWRVAGEPVAFAAVGRPVEGAMSRIGPVYTPAEFRGRGYGSAVTAAAARWALERGAEHVVLFTDLANPVSNSIYRRLGFRAVSDALEVGFRPVRLT